MFKKATAVEPKSQKTFGGKEIKSLLSALSIKFGLNDDDSAQAILGFTKKNPVVLKNLAQSLGYLATDDENILYVIEDTRKLEQTAFPTLLTLWRCTAGNLASCGVLEEDVRLKPGIGPVVAGISADAVAKLNSLSPPLALPRVYCLGQVSQFLLNGADLMAPGLCSAKPQFSKNVLIPLIPTASSSDPRRGSEEEAVGINGMNIGRGSLVAVHVENNPFAVAVGRWMVEEGGTLEEGVAVKVLHRFGDALWERFPGDRIPPGFGGRAVQGLVVGIVGSESEGSDGGAAENDGDDLKVESASAEEAENDAEEDLKAESASAEEDGDGNGNAPPVEDDVNSAPSSPSKSTLDVDGAPAENESVDPKQAMDDLLLRCFLQCLKTGAAKDSWQKQNLPMDINAFYANVLRPARPPGSSVDVKKSSHKKLKKFFEVLQEKTWLELSDSKKASDEPRILSIKGSFPELSDHEAWESTESSIFDHGVGGGFSQKAEAIRGLLQPGVAAWKVETLSVLNKDVAAALVGDSKDAAEVLSTKTIPNVFVENGQVYFQDREALAGLVRSVLPSASKKTCTLPESLGVLVAAMLDKAGGSSQKQPSGATPTPSKAKQKNAAPAPPQSLGYDDFLPPSDDENGGAFAAGPGSAWPAPSSKPPTRGPSGPSSKPPAAGPTGPRPGSSASASSAKKLPPPVTSLPFDTLTRTLVERGCKPAHRIVSLDATGNAKASFKQGRPPQVAIRTEKRMNHNCTLVRGLDSYKLDLAKTLDYLKANVTSGAGQLVKVESKAEKDIFELLLQGFFDAALEECFVRDFGIPAEGVDNTAAGRKKDMRQKVGGKVQGRANVVRG